MQSALIGFLISKLLPAPLSPQEIIVVQTTAVATGTVNVFSSTQGKILIFNRCHWQLGSLVYFQLSVYWMKNKTEAHQSTSPGSQPSVGHARLHSLGYSSHPPSENKWSVYLPFIMWSLMLMQSSDHRGATCIPFWNRNSTVNFRSSPASAP